jgi:Methyltransferase domain
MGKAVRYPVVWIKRKKFERTGLKLATAEERFNWIYENKYWGDGETTSGSGSTLAHTANLRSKLPGLLKKYEIKTILDAPCGDFAWMQVLLRDMSVGYIGGDIVKPMVSSLQAKFATDSVRFVHIDLAKDPLPQADLLMCRDCLFHLSFEDTAAVLQNFIDSGIPFLLTTTHKNKTGYKNKDITTGENRLMDLFTAPYKLSAAPLARIDDWIAPKPEKEMCLWSREQIVESSAKFREDYLKTG